ncbi:hypothetical protein Tco_0797900 [Tanacetum coccineum]
MGKGNMKEPVPRDLPHMPFLGHLKEQMGSPFRTRETIYMIENPGEIHKMKAQEDEGDMDVGWDITVKDVERLRQFLTLTIHTLPNPEPVKAHITPPDDDYVAPVTNPILDKKLNEFPEEFSDITRIAEKANDKELSDVKIYDCASRRDAKFKTVSARNCVVCTLETLTRLHSSTWATKWFKRLVAYAKCNRDSYENELGENELPQDRDFLDFSTGLLHFICSEAMLKGVSCSKSTLSV